LPQCPLRKPLPCNLVEPPGRLRYSRRLVQGISINADSGVPHFGATAQPAPKCAGRDKAHTLVPDFVGASKVWHPALRLTDKMPVPP